MTSDILQKIYAHVSADSVEYNTNRAYVKGKNPRIYATPKKGDPDNRIPVPLAKTSVDDMAGYAGRSEDRVVSFEVLEVDETTEAQDKEDVYSAQISAWMDYNNDALDTSELYYEALSQGKSYQLWWTTLDTVDGFPVKPEYKMISGKDVFIKYSADVKPVKEYAVRFWKDEDNFDGVDDKTIYAMVYYPLYAEAWKSNGDWKRDEANDLSYPYTTVPVIEYKINKDGEPLFEAEKDLIDTIDKIVSKSINEVDRYNALILLLPFMADPAFKQKLVELKVIDDLGQVENGMLPQFLEKNLAGVTDFYKWSLEVMDEYYHKSTKIPDFADAAFGASDDSGESKKMKMLGMEYRAATIDTYFNYGIFERKQMFDDVINAGTSGIDTELYTITVKTKRNLPVNLKESLEIATLSRAAGLSQETIMRNLPQEIVSDWKKELSMMETETVDENTDIQDDPIDDGIVE